MKKNLLALLVLFVVTTTLCKAQIFYGMTTNGGTHDSGTIIRFNAATDKDSVIWNFSGFPSDGSLPHGSLVFDSINGLFYGMTSSGGSNGKGLGAIISFDPTNNSENLIWSFGNGTDGSIPYGNLVYDKSNGLFYGLTGGGANVRGAIISFNPTTNSEKVVWNFGSGTDGAYTLGNLVYDAGTGLFYGTTDLGGTNDLGTIFSFNPTNNSENVVWNFGSGTDGAGPEGSLVYDANSGLLYGMTFSGGTYGAGTIISFNTSTNTDSVLWRFKASKDGTNPDANLVYGPNNGLFYAITTFGGSTGYGAIVSFNTATSKDSVLWNFGNGTDGYEPYGNLVYDAGNGLFYGMTSEGGANSGGVIFSFNTVGNSENVVWSFKSGKDGSGPYGDLVLYNSASGINQLAVNNNQVSIYPNPTSGQFTIKSTSNQPGYTIEVYNVVGKKVYQSVLSNSQNSINLSSQPAGMYFVYLKSNEGVEVGKVLVTK